MFCRNAGRPGGLVGIDVIDLLAERGFKGSNFGDRDFSLTFVPRGRKRQKAEKLGEKIIRLRCRREKGRLNPSRDQKRQNGVSTA